MPSHKSMPLHTCAHPAIDTTCAALVTWPQLWNVSEATISHGSRHCWECTKTSLLRDRPQISIPQHSRFMHEVSCEIFLRVTSLRATFGPRGIPSPRTPSHPPGFGNTRSKPRFDQKRAPFSGCTACPWGIHCEGIYGGLLYKTARGSARSRKCLAWKAPKTTPKWGFFLEKSGYIPIAKARKSVVAWY